MNRSPFPVPNDLAGAPACTYREWLAGIVLAGLASAGPPPGLPTQGQSAALAYAALSHADGLIALLAARGRPRP